MWEAGLSGKKKLQVKVRGIQVFLSRLGRMAGPRLPAVTLIHMERALEGGSGDPNALVLFLTAVIASSARPGDWSAELSVQLQPSGLGDANSSSEKGEGQLGRQSAGRGGSEDAQPWLQETRHCLPSLALGFGKAKKKARCSLSGKT